MKKCLLHCPCSTCPERPTCPSGVRLSKRRRRPMAESASLDLMRRAAGVLATGWYSCETLGIALYGIPGPEKRQRMNIMVRARRPINRLKRLGVLAVRPDAHGTAEYTLLPEGKEVLG